MDAISKFALLADLEEEYCELNHGTDTQDEQRHAVDYLVQPFGYTINEIEQVSLREMVVPVCADCVKALQEEERTLLYCFECCSSQWINHRLAEQKYCHSILWLRGCPRCTSEFGGPYFTEYKAMLEKPLLLKQVPDSAVA